MPLTSTVPLHPAILEAYQVLEGQPLSKELALRLARIQGPEILDLVSLANKATRKFAPRQQACTIMNVKSGACPEDCRFCAQSGHHRTAIDIFGLVPAEAMIAAGRQAYQQGVRTFGIVTSGTGYPEATPEFLDLCAALAALRREFPDMTLCGSFGVLGEVTAKALAAAGMARYNINLQVNPSRYRELVSSTHDIQERIDTIRLLHRLGVECCTGGIFGLGESMEDRVELAYALRELAIEVIPLNVLIPIAGTALEGQTPVPAAEAAKSIAIFRLVNPGRVIKFAAGRETRMKDFQGLLMLSGANGLLTGGYLTTRGREIPEDVQLIQDLESFG